MVEDSTGDFDLDDDALAAQMRPMLDKRIRKMSRLIANQARVNVPVDTGFLGQSIQEDPPRWTGPLRVEGSVTAHAPYAVFVHQGTKPHVIRARNAKALRFGVPWPHPTRTIFRVSVNHPGTKPRPFLLNAAQQVHEQMLKED